MTSTNERRRFAALLAVGTVVVTVTAVLAARDTGSDAPEGAPRPASSSTATATSSTTATSAPVPGSSTVPSTTAPHSTSTTPTGAFVTAPGSSPVAGTGPLRTYTVEVETGTGADAATFAAAVDEILAAPKGWTADGSVSFQRVASDAPSFRVLLATPATTDRLCAPLETRGIYSCRQGEHVVINVLRWRDGATPSRLPLDQYRIYVISHEVGHALGHAHVGCPGAGQPAPVMMQQTKGIGDCSPNPWPFP